MDQALEKEYNKPARGKEAVNKWNLIKHEKAKYRMFLYATCQIDDDDEYSLHLEFSPSVTEADQKSVSSLMDYVLQRGNPFNTDNQYCYWYQSGRRRNKISGELHLLR